MDAKKSKYYDATLANFERARDCYQRAGLLAEWEETVRSEAAAHRRKAGFIAGFEELVADRKCNPPPSFLERAKHRWTGRRPNTGS
jgi:hypothetical protein